MDKSTEDVLVIVLAIAFWVFMLATPLGGEILSFLLRFYGQYAP